MNILFISAYVPSRIRVRPYSFIRTLAARGHRVTLVCGCGAADGPALDELRAVCDRVVAVPVGRGRMLGNALRGLPGELPLQAALAFGPPLLEVVRHEAARGGYDVAHIEHLRGSALGYALPDTPAVLDAVDCISLLFERALRGSASLASRALALLDLARTRCYEAGYTAAFEQVIVTSPEDAWALQTLSREERREAAGETITVVPNGVDLDYFAPGEGERAPATLVFSGKMSYHANVAAALFLAREIMPLVWARRPDVRLVLAGSAPPAAVRALSADRRVTVTGYVPDLRPYLADATIAVAPLRYGVGIQNKVLEALATGTPTIAARQAARALAIADGREMLLARTAPEYAAAILRLLDDPAARAALGAAGRRYVEQHHDWNRIVGRLEEVYHRAMAGCTIGRG
jgi:glycosyltransferase involved in cell wall biosynthesis